MSSRLVGHRGHTCLGDGSRVLVSTRLTHQSSSRVILTKSLGSQDLTAKFKMTQQNILGSRPRYTRSSIVAAAADFGKSSDIDTDINTDSISINQQQSTPPKKSSLAKRAIFGSILGVSGAIVIIIGGWIYAAVASLIAFQCSQEFIGLVNAKGIAGGMKPPPPIVNSAISLMCVGMCAWTFISGGKMASAMAVNSFMALSFLLVAVKKPRFSQLTSVVFGLLYCGYLPAFWIKLRLLAIPAINSTLVQSWQSAFQGVSQATVGLVATFIAVACVIAADTGAYFAGKSLGRTQLSSISPKKTVEGAIGGLISSILVAIGCYKVFAWPYDILSAAALGTIVFISGLFGDLIESVIKRDAGLKDASNLIPGHGGLLDRMDSYLFTGACVYFFTRFVLKGYGV